jgi:hypothetical protein
LTGVVTTVVAIAKRMRRLDLPVAVECRFVHLDPAGWRRQSERRVVVDVVVVVDVFTLVVIPVASPRLVPSPRPVSSPRLVPPT